MGIEKLVNMWGKFCEHSDFMPDPDKNHIEKIEGKVTLIPPKQRRYMLNISSQLSLQFWERSNTMVIDNIHYIGASTFGGQNDTLPRSIQMYLITKKKGSRPCPCRPVDGSKEENVNLLCTCNFKTHSTWRNGGICRFKLFVKMN